MEYSMNEQFESLRPMQSYGVNHALGTLTARATTKAPKHPGLWKRCLNLDRITVTVLFTDIVDSTARVVALGDRSWHTLLDSHHALVRNALAQFHGREIDTAGDGFFAAFESAIDAIRCACAIVDSVCQLGIVVRAGLHSGQCEVIDAKLGGLCVHIGARIVTYAGGGEVLISDAVKDMIAGSGVSLLDRGNQSLKGVPGEWRLYAICREPPSAQAGTSGRG